MLLFKNIAFLLSEKVHCSKNKSFRLCANYTKKVYETAYYHINRNAVILHNVILFVYCWKVL